MCKVDVPCEHQIEDYKEKGWNLDTNREKVYSEFLHLHDFETWQPFCYVKKDSDIFLMLLISVVAASITKVGIIKGPIL